MDSAATDGLTALIVAAQNGFADIVNVLLDHGADVNAKMKDGATALIAACRRGYTDIVTLLLENGGDPTVRFENDSTGRQIFPLLPLYPPLFLSSSDSFLPQLPFVFS